ncbi:nucleoside/nucleotide kinase family protein [Candidatus Laterigemmans baculatus]|uniref:hypothetical protein n=1 Tax=Candidatus Laterigemmans baculatus TaxID=2770505 RepID=UPI0013DC663E|nr:hypothetical protein [Candidatus Laterigemmans baculatus]
MGFTVAMVGPDGAGKTTVCRELVVALQTPAQYVYMGINLECSNVLLPTTRLWLEMKRWRGKRPDMSRGVRRKDPQTKNRIKGLIRNGKSDLRLLNLMGEEIFRQSVCWYWRMRGRLVLCDRDFFCDYYAYDVAPPEDDRGVVQRMHGWLLKTLYRRPDLLIVLEASPEQMLGRKGEGTVDELERRCLEYRQLKSQFKHFFVIDAALPLEMVVQQARSIIEGYQVGRPSLAGGSGT